MDVKYINPFIAAAYNIMPQLGFREVTKKSIRLKKDELKSSGVMIMMGIVGDVKGNVVYDMEIESAKKIASTMMMGTPVNELDSMAQSAISELANMLTANASMNFANDGVNINISTPALMYGDDFHLKTSCEKVLCVELLVDGIAFDINISLNV